MRSSGSEAMEPGGILWFHTHRKEEKATTVPPGGAVEQRQWSQVRSSGSTLTGRKRRALLYLQEEQWSRGSVARWDPLVPHSLVGREEHYCTSRRSSGAEAVEPGEILWFHTHREEEKGNTVPPGGAVEQRQWSQVRSSGSTLTGRKRRAGREAGKCSPWGVMSTI
jgi:hypothetical protein